MNPDGLSYLEIGEALWSGPFSGAVNSYWSPVYPWIVGTALRATGFRSVWEATVVHGVNFVIYVGALLAFEFFWKTLEKRRLPGSVENDTNNAVGPAGWWTLGYGTFLWVSLVLINVWWMTPDLALGAILFVMAGLLLKFAQTPSSSTAFLLGISLGASYLTRAVMFPLAPFYVGSLVVLGRRAASADRSTKRDEGRRHVHSTLAIAGFLILALPWLITLRNDTGIWTFGESGKLNYAWYVNGVQRNIHWQGEPPTYGVPNHGTRRICENPTVFEFDGPVSGTYPPWLDPAHWYRGVDIRFEMVPQLRVLAATLRSYAGLMWGVPVILFALLATYLHTTRGVRRTAQAWLRFWPVALPSLAACALYSLVYVEPRFVGAHLAILAGTLLASIRTAERSRRAGKLFAVAWTSALLVVVCVTTIRLHQRTPQARWFTQARGHDHWAAASALRASGLRVGDRIAAVGYHYDAYWARLVGASIVAEIPWHEDRTPSPDAVLAADDPVARTSAMECVSPLGVRAMIIQRPIGASMPPPWQRIQFDRRFDLWIRYFR